jgi:hypothetical protein
MGRIVGMFIIMFLIPIIIGIVVGALIGGITLSIAIEVVWFMIATTICFKIAQTKEGVTRFSLIFSGFVFLSFIVIMLTDIGGLKNDLLEVFSGNPTYWGRPPVEWHF